MRSLASFKSVLICGAASLLAGCLVSEEPILDASNGKARPLKPGDYISCPIGDDADESDCEQLSVSHDASGLYEFVKLGEEATTFRFRKIARRAYAAQSSEDDDGFMYYYAHGNSTELHLVMMMCEQLPKKLRLNLIKKKALETEDADYEICTVKKLKGLTAAARAYHRGVTDGENEFELVLKPAPASAPSP